MLPGFCQSLRLQHCTNTVEKYWRGTKNAKTFCGLQAHLPNLWGMKGRGEEVRGPGTAHNPSTWPVQPKIPQQHHGGSEQSPTPVPMTEISFGPIPKYQLHSGAQWSVPSVPSSSRAPPHSPGAAAKLPLRLQLSCSDSQDIPAETAVQSQGAGSTGSRQRRWQRLSRTWLEPSYHQCSPRKHPATLEFSENSAGWAVDVSPGISITSL